jgi:hypothetical protein
LFGEKRDEVESCVDARKFLKNFHHSPIVLEGVEASPRQKVSPRGGVAILGLVHVPENNEVYAAQSAAPNARMRFALPCACSIDI